VNWILNQIESDSSSRLPSNRLPAGGTMILNGSHIEVSTVVPCSLVHPHFLSPSGRCTCNQGSEKNGREKNEQNRLGMPS
jgi:hypothetical protein